MPSLIDSLSQELVEAPRLVAEQYERTEPLLSRADCVVATGSGDSFAAALAAETAPGALVVALDPLELSASGRIPRLVEKGCSLLALSVGGRTRSVLEAARRYREAGGHVVAVTASASTPLGRLADTVVEMVYAELAAGIGAARHLVMLAAVDRLFGGEAPPRLSGLDVEGCDWMSSEMHSGCLSGYSAALYTVLKLYEVYGSSVRAERLEQLVHAPVYSVDSVTLYTARGPCLARVEKVYEVLREAGIRSSLLVAEEQEGPAAAIVHGLRSLYCLHELVARSGVAAPAYRRHRGLGPLTELIYG